jgi:hypothetical protein
MADIRIKDLTTTASSTASDDFFAADGTTNGTRKLSAYSPTFGGNATVGGTLTVNSSSIVNGSASGATSYLQIKNNGSSIGLLGSRNAIDGGTATDVGLYVYGANALTLWTNSSVVATFASNGNTTLAGALSVSSTTASTSTSTGALVVSGGMGVAGAIYGGGVINTSVGTGGVGNQLVLNNSATNSTQGRGSAILYTGTGDANLAAIESQTTTASNNTGKLVIKTSNAGTLAIAATYDENGNLIQKVNGTAPSLVVNSTMTFELTSNTSLKIFVRGSDGTTRSTTLTLA